MILKQSNEKQRFSNKNLARSDTMNILLKMENIKKGFFGVPVLHGVNLELYQGEVMALMGENGAGKSTLMKILSGVHTDWSGRILLDGQAVRFNTPREAEQAGIAIIYQELNLVSELTVAENIFLGREPERFSTLIDYQKMNSLASEIMNDLHFTGSVTAPVAQLRVGYQQLVEIGKALSLNARILVMDEPTSALTDSETKVLFSVVQKLKTNGVGIIYITHRMSEVIEIADRITVLRDGHTVGVCSSKKASRQELIKMMVGRDLNQFFFRESKPQEKTVLIVKNLTRKNKDRRKKPLVSNVSFQIREGEILGIAGLLGAGRTELLEALFGAASMDTSGIIELEGKQLSLTNPQKALQAGIALITEDRKTSGLVLSMSVEQNMTLVALNEITRLGLLSRHKERVITENYVDRLSISVSNIKNSIKSLSGGNQQKVLLAKWLATQPRVLLLDEPTRGIDVGAKHEIYVLLSELAKKGLVIIMTSSELPELLSTCDRIMVLREGVMSAIFDTVNATQEKIMDAAAPLN